MLRRILYLVIVLPWLATAQITLTNSSFGNGSGSGTDGTLNLVTLLGSTGSLPQSAPPPTITTADSLALVSLYNATNGASWNNKTNWLTGPANTWYGVTVVNNRVSELNLGANFLTGNLPDLSALTALKRLEVQSNSLSPQPLPSTLSGLTTLEHLDLSNNRFNGVIPNFSTLANLKFFSLSNNLLLANQSFPTFLFSLSNLQTLRLANCRLQGSFPSGIVALNQLKEFDVSGNPSLTQSGTSLEEIGSLSQLQILNLSGTGFSGTFPTTIAALPNLQSVNLDFCNFNHLPAVATWASSAVTVNISNNQFDFGDLEPLAGVTNPTFINTGQKQFALFSQLVSNPVKLFTGDPISFAPVLNGTQNSYQWYFNGNPIVGASLASLVIANAQLTDAGSYQLRVTNSLVPGITLQSTVQSYQVDARTETIFTVDTQSPIHQDVATNTSGGYWADIDQDGDEDLFVGNAFTDTPNFLYENLGNGTFQKITPGDIVTIPDGARYASWGDYDNDGYPDIFVGEYTNAINSPTNDNNSSLYRNNGNKTFTRTAVPFRSDGGLWADYDNDGDLDLFMNGSNNTPNSNKIYKNNGDGTFQLIDNWIPVTGTWYAGWIDIDNDGDLDYNITPGTSSNQIKIFRNNNGSFTEENLPVPTGSFSHRGSSWADIDGDGDMDLFAMNSTSSNLSTVAESQFYINDGTGTFTIESASSRLGVKGWGARGSTFGDVDNDGDLDLFIMHRPVFNGDVFTQLFLNNGTGNFTLSTAQSYGYGDPFSGLSMADYNNDGALDLFIGSFDPGRPNYLYRNLQGANNNHWLKLKLVGVQSNKTAIGTRIDFYAGSQRFHRQILPSSGLQSQNSYIVHSGLSTFTKADSVVIYWPSGLVQRLTNVGANQMLTITEGQNLDALVWYADADNDGHGDINTTLLAQTQPTGFVRYHSDCNDNDSSIYPGAPELCDDVDNDCDGAVDEGCPKPSLWGTLSGGGAHDDGSIYSYNTNGNNTVQGQYAFASNQSPVGSLIVSADGYVYGVTSGDDGVNYGTIFRIRSDGSNYATLHQFSAGAQKSPVGALLEASNGLLYGMYSIDATGGASGIYRIEKNGTGFQQIVDFESLGLSNPIGSLVQDSTGRLFGVAGLGGAGFGAVFGVDADGSNANVLFNFDDNSGYSPGASLVLGTDDFLYGVTTDGSPFGTIFKINKTTGAYQQLYRFDDGVFPAGALVKNTQGRLFGITKPSGNPGQHEYGALYGINADATNFSILQAFNDSTGVAATGDLSIFSNKLYWHGAAAQNAIISYNLGSQTLNTVAVLSTDLGNYPQGSVLVFVQPPIVMATEPTAQPTGFTFSNTTDNALSGSFVAGADNPEGYLVVRRKYYQEFATLTAFNPDQQQTLTFNAKGTLLEGASKVYAHLGLVTENTTDPLFKPWVYVSGNWGQDDGVGLMTAVPGQPDQWSIVLGPSIRQYFSANAADTLRYFAMVFRNAEGTVQTRPDFYISLQQALVALAPEDGQTYTTASVLGLDPVVYVGNSNAFDQSGLSFGSTYTYQVYAYNGSGIGINYRQAAPLTGWTTTLMPIPVDNDNDGYYNNTDCNDSDATVYPTAPELCDGLDNDCDGTVDEGCASPMLWGLAQQGGPGGAGTIFSLSADGSNGVQVQYGFQRDLQNPGYGQLLELPDGSKVGMTIGGGGGASVGGIFKVLPDGTVRTIFSFSGSNGSNPYGSLIRGTDGLLYGMTAGGGTSDYGTVFKINADGTGHTVLHNFNYSNGGNPYGSLIQSTDGSLYGMTYQGGASGHGTIFKINPDGSGHTVLHNFNYSNGGYPWGSLILSADGALYGVTQGGSSGSGTVFKTNPDGSDYTVLHNFNGTDGSYPFSSLLQRADGALYGMTVQGGSSNYGTVFKINPDGSGHTVLHNFNYDNGAYPYGSILQSIDGALYGMTYYGGSSSYGTVFKVNTDGSDYTLLHNFSNANGSYPLGSLIQSTDGSLFGMTNSGGSANAGTVFKINIDGSGHTVLYSFNSQSEGSSPVSSLVQGTNRDLYGISNQGGSSGGGTIFKYSINTGERTLLHNFNYSTGSNPVGSLTFGLDGDLYGMTYQGGSSGVGTVFKISSDGSGHTVLHNFDNTSGGFPYGSLLNGTDGALYGMTYSGGSSNSGTLFKINTNGNNHTVLYNFNQANGIFPLGSLIQGIDSALYGMTQAGGSLGYGTVFKVNKDGSGYTVLHNFNGINGSYPLGSLIQGADGSLYGMTLQGGSASVGTIFKINADGSGYTTLHDFNGLTGQFPTGSLIVYNNKLFGYTGNGGLNGGGTVFNFDLNTATFNKMADLSQATGQYPNLGSLLLVQPPNIQPPTIPAKDIVFSDVNNKSMTVSFTPGNGEKRVVLMKESGEVPVPGIKTPPIAMPAEVPLVLLDGSELVGNSNFTLADVYDNNWRVIYVGSDSSVTVTGLEGNHYYTVTVVEYNGSATNTRYLNVEKGQVFGKQATLPDVLAPTVPASNISFTNVLSSSMHVNFNPGNGQQRLALIKAGSAPTFVPADDVLYAGDLGNGETAFYTGNGSSFTLTGLQPTINYFVTIFEFNSDSVSTKYLVAGAPVANQTTLALPNVLVVTPANGAINQNASLNVTARAVTGASVYTIELSEDSTFNYARVRSGPRTLSFDTLQYNTLYYTRVKTNLRDDYGAITTFTTRPAESLAFVTTPANGATGINTVLNITSNTVLYATSYTIQLSESPDFDSVAFEVTGASRTLAFSGLRYNTTYYNRVRTNLSSAFGQVRSFTTRPAAGLAYVTSPANGAVSVNNNTLNITSNSVPGAALYTIQLSESSTFDSVAFEVTGTTRTLAFAGLKYNTTYFNRVLTNVSEDYGQVRSFTTRTAESISYVTSPGNNAINVSTVLNITANPVPGATSYIIQLSESAAFDVVAFEVAGGTRTLPFSGLKYNTLYYNRVKTDMGSDFGQVRSFTTRTAESISFVTSPSNGAINVNPSLTIFSNSVPGASSYTIQLSETSDFATIHFEATGSSRSLPFTGLKYGTTYYNRVITNLTLNYGQVRSFTTRTLESYAYVTSPANNATNVNTTVNVTSNTVPGATSYTIQLSTLSDFSVINFESSGTRTRLFTGLLTGTTYYNRVLTDVTSVPGQVRSFTTQGTPPGGRIAAEQSTAGEQPVLSAFKVHVYPNPFEDKLRIMVESAEQENAEIQMLDMTGRPVYQSLERTNTDVEITRTLPSGIYLITVKAGPYQEVIRVSRK